MAWSPESGEAIYEGTEAGSFNTTITYIPDGPGEVQSYSVELEGPIQSAFIVSASSSGILAKAVGDTLAGSYPMESITYLDKDYNPVIVTTWDEVPYGVIMVSMIPDPNSQITWSINCSCVWEDQLDPLLPVMRTATGTLYVSIYHSYDADQLSLLKRVEEQQL